MTITVRLSVKYIPKDILKAYLIRKAKEIDNLYKLKNKLEKFTQENQDKLFETEEKLFKFLERNK